MWKKLRGPVRDDAFSLTLAYPKTPQPLAHQTPNPLLLNVYDPAIHECDLQVFVNVNLFRTQIHHLGRLAHRTHHLIRSHPHLDGLRLRLSLLLLSAGLLLPLLVASLWLPALLLAPLRLLRIITDSQQLPDRVFDITGAGPIRWSPSAQRLGRSTRCR